MKKVKFLALSLIFMLLCGTMQAQFGKRLGKAVENAAKRTVERKAEQKTEEAVGKAIDKATDPDTYKDKDNDGGGESRNGKKAPSQKQSATDAETSDSGVSDSSADAQQDAPKGVKAAEMAYAKSDFVPGDEIIFSDDLANEQLGEFPSQWDLLDGTCEVLTVNGVKALELNKSGSSIMPLMKTPKNFLGDVWTVEFDFMSSKREMEWSSQWVTFFFNKADDSGESMKYEYASGFNQEGKADGRHTWSWHASMGHNSGDEQIDFPLDKWHHIAISFNKRAWKIYVNGQRIMNVPNVATPPGWFNIRAGNGDGHSYFTNFRIAKGAVPLYDRLTTDGKIITYGITFDVGKSTIKPESMGEINRIAKLMTDTPDLKFSVEGHTDNTGSVATNQKLSDERSAAVVAKLVEMGVAAERLASAGKGQTAPIADNATDEGRAKNRRVEFVKMN
ncbi:MAG: OmpA family protein [Prevotellaceae bacterium]|jgi:outer membrane protein OmpA-like peptidoglycan-associated protein|nr:OmpA family protein [Prevotellaceae bacterium]